MSKLTDASAPPAAYHPASATLHAPMGHRVPADWREDVMIFAGVRQIAAIKDEVGKVVEVLVSPALSKAAYEKALRDYVPPKPEPTTAQLKAALAGLGLSERQVGSIFDAAASLQI